MQTIRIRKLLSKKLVALGVLPLMAAYQSSALAAISEAEIASLGTTLTPVGAEKAGNADGSIPAWDGGLAGHPDYRAGDDGRPVNPFKDDKPLFVIDASNYKDYGDKITEAHKALFEKYPETFKMPIYQSRRTASMPQEVYDAAKLNASNAKLSDNGNNVENHKIAVPFPIPKTGVEPVWNHVMRYRGGSVQRYFTQAVVQENGNFMAVEMEDQFVFPEYFKGGLDPKVDDNRLFYYIQAVKSPARLSGNILLVHETIDQVEEPRLAWIYNAGQRRVRRAPQVSYDGPGTASDGLRTSDNFDLYNGAPDRYDWKLIGKSEKYIAYNSYNLMDPELKYSDIIKPGHMNSELTRYELHRVWQVEATLKEGKKHLYARRVFNIDEDTWQIATAEQYDGRGELWRVSESYHVQFPQANAPWYAAEAIHDLVARRYLVIGLSNEESEIIDFGYKAKRKDFTSGALRRAGKR